MLKKQQELLMESNSYLTAIHGLQVI